MKSFTNYSELAADSIGRDLDRSPRLAKPALAVPPYETNPLAAFPRQELFVIRLARHSLALAALVWSTGSLSAQAAPPPTDPPPAPPSSPLLPPPPPAPEPAAAAAMVAPAPPAAPVYLATRDEALSIGRATTQQVYENQLDALMLARGARMPPPASTQIG